MRPDDVPLPSIDGDRSVDDVRNELRHVLANGESMHCPCCGGNAKVYARPINGTMVAALRAIARSTSGLTNAQIIAITKQAGGGNVSLLQHWRLVDRWPGSVWRITPHGRDFLLGRVAVPARVLLYNNQFLGFDDSKDLHVSDLAENDFSLDEILLPDAVRRVDISPNATSGV